MGPVLVVDDDADLVDVMTIFLEDAGILCLPAHSLAEVEAYGVRVLGSPFALLDVNLGQGQPSGLDVAAYLRSMDFQGHIVFITGHAQDHPLVRQALGPRGLVLSKPVDTKALLKIITDS
ncbi:MAG: response regulator [Polyangiaceae bacterium]|nr:response regulator [Polyangiaceae bacterium]